MLIQKIKFENWRGFRGVSEYNLEGVATISGRNGLGKTTFADAVSYVLCGCNARGVADFEVRPVANKEPMRGGVYAVTLTIEHAGEVTTITRGERDVESRKRGSVDITYKREGVREVDGVAVSVAEYEAVIAKYCGGQTAKGLTFADWIFQLPIAQRRAYLLGLVSSDEQEAIKGKADLATANISAEFKEGETPAQYKKRVVAHVSEMKKARDLNAAKIEENFAQMSNSDAPADDEVEAIKAQIEAIKTEKASDEVTRLLADINLLSTEQAEYLAKVRKDADARIKEQQARRSVHLHKRSVHLADIADLQYKAKRINNDIKDLDVRRAGYMQTFEDARTAYAEARNASLASPEIPVICPYCGEPIAEHRRAEIVEREHMAANNTKRQQLQIILEKADKAKKGASLCDEQIGKMREQLQAIEEQIANFNAEVAAIDEHVATMDKKINEINDEVTLADATDYMAERYDIIDAARRQIKHIEEAGESDAEAKKAHLHELQAQLDDCQQRAAMAKEDAARRKRILELQDANATLADEIALAETKKMRAEEYERLLADGVTERVNAKFPAGIEWQFSEPQLNGGINDVAEVYVNGVNIRDVNNAQQILAKLAITIALQDAHGVNLPIFVDNAESVNEFPVYANRQVIGLVVTDNPQLQLN